MKSIDSAVLILNQILISCCPVYLYDIKCPDLTERRLRAKGFCGSHTLDHYACLYDVNAFIRVESCDVEADYSSPGEKYVISGARTTVACSLDTYQPFALWANISSRCLYNKSKCNEDGQIPSSNGSVIVDRSCQCDFKNGFHFVTKPRDPCNCLPLEEDCSCYFDPFNDISIAEYLCTTVTTDHNDSPFLSNTESTVKYTELAISHNKLDKGKQKLN
ncbi:uncharacterized protein LOC127732788 [Mytilus californianus]|uniref:uncharacterized protein LOC127732788 n=1 Tax=Mytilus californianus TaxID=6549 RepID=UPI00224570B1|nr:uncharacterized protein LOC127732788 [Mytilus californianus]